MRFSVLLIAAILALSHASHDEPSSLNEIEDIIAANQMVLLTSEVKDCGKSDAYIHFDKTIIKPDPVIYPGSVVMDVAMTNNKDLPSNDLMMKLRLEKLQPFHMIVPCLNGVGSW